MKHTVLLLSFSALLTFAATTMAATPSAEGAKVYIVSPADGDTVSSPVKVKFGLDGMEVVPAGTDKPNSGHHHLLINTDEPDMDKPIPKDAKHVHFGKGQTETTVELEPGRHTLQLLLGDKAHIPHNPPVASEVITITVK